MHKLIGNSASTCLTLISFITLPFLNFASALADADPQVAQQAKLSTDNPNVRLPGTLPNWLLIPQTSEDLVEAGVENSATGYTPVLIAGTPIVSSPYYGVQTEFQGSELLVNASTINKDLALLQVRQNFYNALTRRGEPIPTHPIIELSGLVQGQILKHYAYDHDMESDIDLTAAEIDIFAGLTPWVSAFLQFEYDNSKDRPRRISNSSVHVGSAFSTIGNLNASDFYFTLGQMYVPFGQYSSSLVSSSMAKQLGRMKQRAALLGYSHQLAHGNINAAAFVYRGNTDTKGSWYSGADDVNGVGGNINVLYSNNGFKASVGASVVNNLAETDGLQSIFSQNQATEFLGHAVPGIDVRGSLGKGPHSVKAEYVGVTRDFDDAVDFAHNDDGAAPRAVHVEYDYNFTVKSRPSTLAIGYDHSWDALAMGLPENRASIAWSITPWRATIISLEYRYDQDYDDDDYARVRGDGFDTVSIGTGNCAHSLTAQLDVYF